MRMRDLAAIAVDYDRTLTDPDLRLVEEAVESLRRARRMGKRVIVVSGRDLPFLERELPGACDVIVAENGCLVRAPDGRIHSMGAAWDLRVCLEPLGVPIEYGARLASFDLGERARVEAALRAAGVEADLVPNRDRVMVLPRGVDKAAGLLRALELLGVPPEQAAAAGDGENDVAMLLMVGHAIAVANAVDELKAIADVVTRSPGGHGIVEWLEERWLREEVRA